MRINKIKTWITTNSPYLWWRWENESSLCTAHAITVDTNTIIGICNCGKHNLSEDGENLILSSKKEIEDFILNHGAEGEAIGFKTLLQYLKE